MLNSLAEETIKQVRLVGLNKKLLKLKGQLLKSADEIIGFFR